MNNAKKGQGMIEMIFAIGILLLALVGLLSLAQITIVGQSSAEFQVIANNIGREGVEVVRNHRDSNWLSGQAWNTGLGAGFYVINFDSNTERWTIDSLVSPTDADLYLDASQRYVHAQTGKKTLFSRMIALELVCQATNGVERITTDNACDTDETQIGISVRSIVDWRERGRSHQVVLTSLLYAWK